MINGKPEALCRSIVSCIGVSLVASLKLSFLRTNRVTGCKYISASIISLSVFFFGFWISLNKAFGRNKANIDEEVISTFSGFLKIFKVTLGFDYVLTNG